MRILGKAARALLVATALVALAQASNDAFGAAASTTTLTSSPNPSAFGTTVTLKAIVGSAGAPAGTVTFKDGPTSLGDGAVDTLGVGQPIAAGYVHTCAVTSAGGVKCWGYNQYGQLGSVANGNPNPNPLDVTDLGSGVAAIAAGNYHTCALTSAGGVKCWGYNYYGQLGSIANNSTNNANPNPLDVTDLGSGVAAIAGGAVHTCALTSAGGVKCWGHNGYGQLGRTSGTGTPNPTPLDVTGLESGVVAVVAGDLHTCALTSAGGVKCWGRNLYGQLGNATNAGTQIANPSPLDVTGLGSGVIAIAVGENHTCALTSAGGVKCWGYNYYGQLGSTANNNTSNPNPAPLDVTGLGSGVAAIEGGAVHTCALTSAGGVKCWGYNYYGQLGSTANNSTTNPNSNPLDVTELGSGVAALAVGNQHTCALTSAGAGKCWGYNYYGQVGSATNINTGNPNPTPLDVSNLTAMVFGKATLATAALGVGSHSLTAEYSGDIDHDPSTSAPVSHFVPRIPTNVALDSSLNPSAIGQSVTFTATVTSAHGPPEGTVVFRKGGSNFAIRTLAGGIATFETAALPAGTHSITARYQRSDDFRDSTSAPVSQEVAQGQTTTTLTVRPASSVPGQPVNLNASVAAVAPATGKPTGTVSFTAGETELGTAPVINLRATLTLDDLGMGNHSITATYAGNTNFATSTSSASAAVVSPLVGGAMTVNQNTANAAMEKEAPTISRLADGGYVVAWQQQTATEGWNILARRYQANGRPAGKEFRVNAARANDQIAPSAAGLTDGSFVVVWASNQKPAFGFDIFGQRYDAAGVPVGGPFRVNTAQASDQSEPAIAALGGDGFVVVWTSSGQDGSGTGVHGQRYDWSGTQIGAEFPVNTTTDGSQSQPAVAMLPVVGGFVVTWTDPVSDNDIHGQRYDQNWQPVGGEFRVNATQTSGQQRSAVSAFADGGFVVVWDSRDQDGAGLGVYGQRYDAAGAAAGAEFPVNATVAGDQFEPSVAAFPDGGFVVLWSSPDAESSGVFGQAYDAAGAPTEGEFPVNSATAGAQERPRAAGFSGGKFVAAWHSLDAGEHAIVAQRMQVQGLVGP